MTEAKFIRKQHFQSQIFAQELPPAHHRSNRSNTFQSSVFAELVPDRVKQRQVQTPVNFARKKYQTESNVMEGAVEQAALVVDKNKERSRPSSMKTAGKKESPTCDFTYKPRTTMDQKSLVFTLSQNNSDLLEKQTVSSSQSSFCWRKVADSGDGRLTAPNPKQKYNVSQSSTDDVIKSRPGQSRLRDSLTIPGTTATLQKSNTIGLLHQAAKGSVTSQPITKGQDATVLSPNHTGFSFSNAQREAQIIDFAVSGLRPSMTSEELRRLCGNVQIVSVKTEGDPVSGECTGFGTIQARVSPQATKQVSYMELNLAEQGVSISQKVSGGKRQGFIR